MKPFMGASGVGIYKPDLSTKEKITELYNQNENSDMYFAEEMFVQTGPLHEVNPSSVNTVRIFTLYDGEKVNFMFAGVRFGGGDSVVDNIHSGGMVCELDIDSGKIKSCGINTRNQKFSHHPKTKVFLPGVQVPQWDLVKKMVEEAALINPNIGHCAWDIAVSNEKVSFIEANDQGTFELIQCASQRGYKPDYDKIIKFLQ